MVVAVVEEEEEEEVEEEARHWGGPMAAWQAHRRAQGHKAEHLEPSTSGDKSA